MLIAKLRILKCFRTVLDQVREKDCHHHHFLPVYYFFYIGMSQMGTYAASRIICEVIGLINTPHLYAAF